MSDSSDLSKAFASQGYKIPIRKERPKSGFFTGTISSHQHVISDIKSNTDNTSIDENVVIEKSQESFTRSVSLEQELTKTLSSETSNKL